MSGKNFQFHECQQWSMRIELMADLQCLKTKKNLGSYVNLLIREQLGQTSDFFWAKFHSKVIQFFGEGIFKERFLLFDG